MNAALKDKIIHFIENFQKHIGKTLLFKEAISVNKDNFDRHFTTFSSSEFILTNFAVRISGARIMFNGTKLSYEIGADFITQFEDRGVEIEFLEIYSDKIYRRTILKIQ